MLGRMGSITSSALGSPMGNPAWKCVALQFWALTILNSCKFGIRMLYIYIIYIYMWLLIKIPLSRNGHYSRINTLLSRTPCLSFAGPMLANNTSYEDSFTACQITPENHGSLLGSPLNMQLASRNPFSGQFFFAKFTGPPPSTCTLTFARSFA